MELLPKALLITLIGMGLVFVVIFLLWGLMALLVRLTAEAEDKNKDAETCEGVAVSEAPRSAEPDPVKVRAAAAAVAVAAALAAWSTRGRPADTVSSSSPWKDTHRAMEINRRSGCFNRQ